MQVKNGIYAAKKTDDGVRTVFVDEEILELSRLNRRSAANKAKTENENIKKQEVGKRRTCFVRQELKLLCAGAVIALGWCTGLVKIGFAVPVLLGIQAALCFWAGEYKGKTKKKG